jgi:hypothetical protein
MPEVADFAPWRRKERPCGRPVVSVYAFSTDGTVIGLASGAGFGWAWT